MFFSPASFRRCKRKTDLGEDVQIKKGSDINLQVQADLGPAFGGSRREVSPRVRYAPNPLAPVL